MSLWRFFFLFGLILSPCAIRAGTLAQFRTAFGDIEVELYDQDKPVTVQNFIRYVQSGRYQNEFAHRIVPGFVVQGGGFAITNRGTPSWQEVPIPTFANITNEFARGKRYSNVYGTIAMAKLAGDTNSASSQWFFNLANNSFLDAADTNNLFVVFGHVVRGTNILNIFNGFKVWSGYTAPPQSTNLDLHQYYLQPFDDLPLLYPAIADTNFLYMDISLLEVAITNVAGARQISWNSPGGLTNVVEFATNFSAPWATLLRTNGTGNRITVLDNAAGPNRMYRVRVDY